MGNHKGPQKMRDTDIAYIAGLFDGEGSIDFKRRKEKRGKYTTNAMQITMRIEMTDQSILKWIHDTLKLGTVRKRNRSPSVKKHWKDRWVYTLRFRQAYQVCCLIWPYAHVKLDKIQQIIDHYNPKIFNDKVVDLDTYRKAMALE
tara:strand:+ start:63 stop:497 length:435 start_codon:yes stop_codon:yes gene_type:complete